MQSGKGMRTALIDVGKAYDNVRTCHLSPLLKLYENKTGRVKQRKILIDEIQVKDLYVFTLRFLDDRLKMRIWITYEQSPERLTNK